MGGPLRQGCLLGRSPLCLVETVSYVPCCRSAQSEDQDLSFAYKLEDSIVTYAGNRLMFTNNIYFLAAKVMCCIIFILFESNTRICLKALY